jgi:hypothetical protein
MLRNFSGWNFAWLFVSLMTIHLTSVSAAEPFDTHGPLQISKSKTYLEHKDGTAFFFLADTCWTGPALSDDKGWAEYLADRKHKGFTAIQFNMVSPWRTAPTDAEGRQSYTLNDGKLTVNTEFYSQRLDQKIKAITDAGLLAVPVLCWANNKGDAGVELNEEQLTQLIQFELDRYKDVPALWILAGDNGYKNETADKWKRIGQKVFAAHPELITTTHPTGMNFPWANWENEKWLNVWGYQSGHGDGEKPLAWMVQGPPRKYGQAGHYTHPVINLEPPYEKHLAYESRKPHSAYNVRRAVYWSLLTVPPAGVTYGGHGVWSWHTAVNAEPTGHKGTGIAPMWNEGLQLPGATEMGYVRKLFESLPWTELRPAQDLITQNDKNVANFIACAATPDHKVVVIYYPREAQADAKLKISTDNADVKWFNPRNGESKVSKTIPDTKEDWILVIRQR